MQNEDIDYPLERVEQRLADPLRSCRLSCLPVWSHLLHHGGLHSSAKGLCCHFFVSALSWPNLSYSCRPPNQNSACPKPEHAHTHKRSGMWPLYQFLLRISWPQWEPLPIRPQWLFSTACPASLPKILLVSVGLSLYPSKGKPFFLFCLILQFFQLLFSQHSSYCRNPLSPLQYIF